MSSLGIVPIRYKSTRLHNKTFRMIGGKLLIDWTIEAISNSQLDDFIVLSACKVVKRYCDDNHIKVICRPIGLESHTAPVIDSIKWLNDNPIYGAFEVQMLLQVTNPTRTSEDIDKCLDLMNIETVNSICSVVDVGEFHPNRMFQPLLGNGLKPLVESCQWMRTQRLPKLFLRDGSIYCWKMKAFRKQRSYDLLPDRIMSYEVERERSIRIDTMHDLGLAEKYLTSLTKPV
jgi:CMP-N-acetylneuraminic acid synthetase